MQNVDSGPRPYFTDDSNPPVYDKGLHIEIPAEEGRQEENLRGTPTID
jgi:hypothetical protein